VVSDGAKVVLLGIVVGVGAAVVSTRFLSTLLYDVRTVDPLVFAGMSLMMLGVGALASYLPARRASNVNPVESMRSD
jgi:ABC-type antimicrobial peptide transport system permease subunit